MARTEKLEITLPAEQAELIRQRVACGDYESADQMVADSLRRLDERGPDEALVSLRTPSSLG